MCGIFGYLGSKNALPLVMDGLAQLEYRGYDSAGFAAVLPGRLLVRKTVGPVRTLVETVGELYVPTHLAIGHTRWATHGVPTVTNAHPHCDAQGSCALVHNGIIENHNDLRGRLFAEGVSCSSETDSEVMVQLLSYRYAETGDLIQSFSWMLAQLTGSFACAVVHEEYPDLLLCACQDSPLLIGIGDGDLFVASDLRAFVKHTRKVQALASGEIAMLSANQGVRLCNFDLGHIERDIREISCQHRTADKQGYRYYMLKEIDEQPDIFQYLVQKYVDREGHIKSSFLDGFSADVKTIHIVACGSSYHAGLLAKYYIELFAEVPVHVEVASEFRYRCPCVKKRDLVILISQSGETADTLAALRTCREREVQHILGFCNVEESALAMGVDSSVFLEVGIEVGVASTKAFTSQLLLLTLFGVKLGKMRGVLSLEQEREIGKALWELPNLGRRLLEQEALHHWANVYRDVENVIFLGRRWMFPVCLESALKMKEVAYVEANAYPAGEMKHGPIALISKGSVVVALCGDPAVYTKMVGAIMEVKARQAHVIALASENCQDIAAVSDTQIYIPHSHPILAPILYSIAGQLMAYHLALNKGAEIDCPRNLAKSVTVE